MNRITLEQRMKARIRRSKRHVFMRQDFKDLGSNTQIGKVLKQLIEQEHLTKISHGMYAKTSYSELTGHLTVTNGLRAIDEALRRLGITPTASTAQRTYNSGKSTQVPTGRCFGITGKRTHRTFQLLQTQIYLEWMPNDANTLEGTMETWPYPFKTNTAIVSQGKQNDCKEKSP